MTIKSSQDLVNNALKEIKTITSNEAAKLFRENKCNLIDIRDIRELERDGRVKNSLHIPRVFDCILVVSLFPLYSYTCLDISSVLLYVYRY